MESMLSQLNTFFRQQLEVWPDLRAGVDSLGRAKCREVLVRGDPFHVLLNSGRMRSICAKVDQTLLEARPCFLCPVNRPPAQGELALKAGFIALANPMPIFKRHFTIAHRDHRPQDFAACSQDLLELGRMLSPEFLVFFNGALAGASAPDHLHFQACPWNSFPALRRAWEGEPVRSHRTSLGVQIELFSYAGRSWISLSGKGARQMGEVLQRACSLCAKARPRGDELLNVVVHVRDGVIKVLFIPRSKHRPGTYFATGKERMLISPAAVELSGVMVSARSEDFERLDEQTIGQILDDVLLGEDELKSLAGQLVES